MIRTEALGNDGQGGGGDSKPSLGRRAWNWISNLFGRNKNKVEVGPAEKISEERFSNQISTWQIVSALLFNSTDPYSGNWKYACSILCRGKIECRYSCYAFYKF